MAERLVEEYDGEFGARKQYKSRRDRRYDDDESDDKEQVTDQKQEDDEDDPDKLMKPHPMFRNNREQFKNLLKLKQVTTKFPIQTVSLTYDSKRALTVTKKGEREYWVRIYDLESCIYDRPGLTFEEQYGGGESDYIKMKEIEQNSTGDKFALAYYNDGKFKVRVFQESRDPNKQLPERRTPEQIEATEFDVNQELKINDWTMAIDGFPDPFICCCFIADDLIFVNLFYNYTLTHYHFIFNTQEMVRVGDIEQIELKQSSIKNFPYKCFYNPDLDEIYSFYRQGQSFIIPKDNPSDYLLDRMTDMDLGQMYLIYNQCMAIRSSSQILFFKIEPEEFTGRRKWVQYDTIQSRGLIFYIKGNARIQVTTDDKIQFFKIDTETLKPQLENVMYNFMNCNQMMFGSKVRYCITYKTNQKSFTIYRRKYEHNFKIPVVQDDLEGSKCLELRLHDIFLCTNKDKVNMYHSETFEWKGMENIPLLADDGAREPNEIIALQVCQNEEFIAVISGKRLIGNQEKINQLFLFRFIFTKEMRSENENPRFELVKRLKLVDRPEFKGTCMNFHFKNNQTSKLLFAKEDQIFSLDYMEDKIGIEYKFDQGIQMTRQPTFFCTNTDQTVFVVASDMDCVYVNKNKDAKNSEIDIDKMYQVSCIKQIMFDTEDKVFYILSNKYGRTASNDEDNESDPAQGTKHSQKLGFYVLKIDMDDPTPKKDQDPFMIKWKNKLDIDDCNIQILRAKDYENSETAKLMDSRKVVLQNTKRDLKDLKEIIISFKQIFINTYNVICMDISGKNQGENQVQNKLVFRHERFQLWETEIQGFLTKKSTDFVTVNREGINILGLSSSERPRVVKDADGYERRLHSLESMNYLNLNSANSLYFDCSKQSDRWVNVQQEYTKDGDIQGQEDSETNFQQIYRIKIWGSTLRELLIFRSIYLCQTTSAIVEIVQDQPTPEVFYKSYLEFDGSNMVSILSFDSRSMGHLLNDDFAEYFSYDSPIFYRTKTQKGKKDHYRFFYRNAIDNALRNNQLKAAQLIVDYVCKYQNNFYSSYLFLKCFSHLFDKGINMVNLMQCDVFNFSFDFDEWPSSHSDPTDISQPYNGSVFDIRYKETYNSLFDHCIEPLKDPDSVDERGKKPQIYKIRYTINLLPRLSEHIGKDENGRKIALEKGTSIMSMCVKFGEEQEDGLEIFDTDSIKELIDFKWSNFGQNHHMIGLVFHSFQILAMIVYINFVYITDYFDIYKENNYQTGVGHPQSLFAFSLLVCLLWPVFYEALRCQKEGVLNYLRNFANYPQLLYVMASILMTITHVIMMPQDFICKLIMILVIALMIARTFKQMRIIEVFAHIVEMLFQVSKDLQVFIFFYFIIIILFSMLISVLGIGNPAIEKDFRLAFPQPKTEKEELEGRGDVPNSEYKHIGLVVGHMIDIIKMSVGDFGIISKSMYTVDTETNYLFWLSWFVIALIACIIFLNFIIAEASASYEKVSSCIDETILKAKANLIAEAEMMRPLILKNNLQFPKYIITRKVEK